MISWGLTLGSAVAAGSAAQTGRHTAPTAMENTNARILTLISLTILFAQQFLGNGQQLYVAGPLINPADLRIAIQFLHRIILCEADPAMNFDGLGRHLFGDLGT